MMACQFRLLTLQVRNRLIGGRTAFMRLHLLLVSRIQIGLQLGHVALLGLGWHLGRLILQLGLMPAIQQHGCLRLMRLAQRIQRFTLGGQQAAQVLPVLALQTVEFLLDPATPRG